jgi:hypothetical protein
MEAVGSHHCKHKTPQGVLSLCFPMIHYNIILPRNCMLNFHVTSFHKTFQPIFYMYPMCATCMAILNSLINHPVGMKLKSIICEKVMGDPLSKEPYQIE